MSHLIYCAVCEGKCSSDLSACPHCGHKLSDKPATLRRSAAESKQGVVFGGVIFLLGGVGMLASQLISDVDQARAVAMLSLLGSLVGIAIYSVAKVALWYNSPN